MSHAKYNLWKPEYAVDIDEIDAQHKKFFEYCSGLVQLADPSSEGQHTNADLVNMTFKVRTYGFWHFMDEEALMLKYKYPQMITHVREHNQYFVQFFTHIEKEYNIFNLDITALMDEKSRSIAMFLSDFAVGWLEQHIYDKDKSLADYLKKKM
jgi:hemerythrin